MWSLQWPRFCTNHMLPSTLREKPMVLACDEPSAVFELHRVSRLDARPLCEYPGRDEASVGADSDSPVDRVADGEISEGSGAPVCHQDLCLASHAINTRMTASPIRIDRPVERHV